MTDDETVSANLFEPEPTVARPFGDWLSVDEAVAYCSAQGLSRTQKTIRKWAARSFSIPESAELKVRREDVDNGFRWVIERASLDVKIAQELEFEARRAERNRSEPVRAGAEPGAKVSAIEATKMRGELSAEMSESVRAGSAARPQDDEDEAEDERYIEQLEQRIADKDEEISFLRDQIRDGRRTSKALTDVIETFRLTAQSNAQRQLKDAHSETWREPEAGAGDNPIDPASDAL